MRGCLPRTVQGRAIIAVVALYALLLQAFLGGLAPVSPVSAGGVICAEHGDSAVPGDHGPACHQHACCVAAQAAKLLDQLTLAFATVDWVSVRVSSVPRREAGILQARAPPDQSVSPRGPPTV